MPGPCGLPSELMRTTLLGAGMKQHLSPGVTSGGHKSKQIQTRGPLASTSGVSKQLDSVTQQARNRFEASRIKAQAQTPLQAPVAAPEIPVVGDISKKVVAGADRQSKAVTSALSGLVTGNGVNAAKMGVLMGENQKSATAIVKIISEVKNWNTYFSQMTA